jgi:hypothetical protein
MMAFLAVSDSDFIKTGEYDKIKVWPTPRISVESMVVSLRGESQGNYHASRESILVCAFPLPCQPAEKNDPALTILMMIL